MSKYQSVRGTRDLLPNLKKTFRHIEQTAYKTACNYGFHEIETHKNEEIPRQRKKKTKITNS